MTTSAQKHNTLGKSIFYRLTQYRELISAFKHGHRQGTPNIDFHGIVETVRLIRHASLALYCFDQLLMKSRKKPKKYSQSNRVKLRTLSRVDLLLLKCSVNSLL